LNAVAPLITMFFMITYALINFSVFLLSIGKSPGWRPSFKYSHWSTGLLGFLLCMGIMFLIEYMYAFIAILFAFFIWAYIHYSEQDISWGSAQEARNHNEAINKMLKLRKDHTHVKNYRPSFLVMTGRPEERPHLVYFGNCLRKASHSLVVYAHVSIGSYLPHTCLSVLTFKIFSNIEIGILVDFFRVGALPSQKNYRKLKDFLKLS